MPSQRTFEGPDLEALLARIRAEVGDGAEIIEANKLRSGGLGGFFARETFEVIVEIPDGPARPALLPTAPEAAADGAEEPFQALSLLELAERVSDAEEAGRFATALESAVAADEPGHLELVHHDDALDLAPRRRRQLHAERHPEPTAHPAPAAEAPVLAAAYAEPSRAAAATAARRLTTAPAADWPAGEAIAAAEPAAHPLAMAQTGALRAPTVNPALVAAAIDGDRLPVTRPHHGGLARIDQPLEVAGDVATAVEPYRMPATARRIAVPAVPTPGQRERALDRWALHTLGVPAEIAGMVRGDDSPTTELLRILERLPQPLDLPRGKGAVIAVVGERDDALELATILAADLGQRADDVVLAARGHRAKAVPSDRRIDDAIDAESARRSWRRRNRPTLVAVDAPVSRDRWNGAFGLDVLDALEPSMVWGTVTADRKPEDVTAWASTVGGLDALALTHLDATTSPAAVLACDIPVGRLDGLTATPVRWAALLTERLAA